MRNCKEEFLEEIEGKDVLCAYVTGEDSVAIEHKLPIGFSKEDFSLFLTEIDFIYDAGYGGQEVFGIIWYKDGTWSDRGEYDGSEWWNYNRVPDVPDCLSSK